MTHTVTRQNQYHTGNNVVEISAGGLDYANPDALGKKYPGEFETFDDPREAVDVAIKIAHAWKKDRPDLTIEIDHGSTGGFTMPFDGMELSEENLADLKKWAEEQWEKLEKCVVCGEVLKEGERYGSPEYDEFDCCSEHCAEKAYSYNEEEEE